ncbi:Ig-like domain-containing protein [Halocola ammonii]
MSPFKIGFFLLTTTLFCALISTTGCKKEDTEAPSVDITFPTGNPTYNVLDTIEVAAQVEDNEGIESVSFSLTNSGNATVASGTFISAGGNASDEFVGVIPVTNIQLSSGVYFINVVASDGKNEGRDFLEIQLNEVPLEREAVLVFSRSATSDLQVDTLGENNELATATNFSSDFTFGAANSHSQTVLITGEQFDGASVLNFPDFELISQAPSLNESSEPFYNDLYLSSFDNDFYVTSRDDRIRSYNGVGNQQLIIQTQNNFRPFEIAANEDHIFVEEVQIGNGNRRLSIYNRSSGTFFQSAPTQFDFVDIETVDSDRTLLAANDQDGNGRVIFYIFNGNYFDEINSTLPDGAIHDLCKVDDNNFLIAHDDGIFRYSLVNNNIYNVSPGIAAEHLAYDRATGAIFASEGNEFHAISYQTGSTVATYSVDNPIEGIDVMYNK